MYKIEDQDFIDYIEATFSEEEQKMFYYIVNTTPENILDLDGEENKDLLTLIALLAKTVGNSRELILNLENAHDLKQLIKDITDIDKEHLRENNYQLLALKAMDIGFDIDTNLLKDETYRKQLETHFHLILNQFTRERSRGTKAALYQVLRDYNAVDPRLNFPQVEVLEPYESDNKTEEEIEPGKVRIYLGETPSDFVDLIDDTYYLKPGTALHDFIMDVKPAGVFYEILVKALVYVMYNTSRSIDQDNKTTYWAESQTGNKFRPYKRMEVNNINAVLHYTDNLTSLDDMYYEVGVTPRSGYPFTLTYGLYPNENYANRLEDGDGLTREASHKYIINVPKVSAIEDLRKWFATFSINDPHDYYNYKEFHYETAIPEEMKESTFDMVVEQHLTEGLHNKVQVKTYNPNNRQPITIKHITFNQDDNEESFIWKSSQPVLPTDELHITEVTNNTDKAWHGTIKTTLNIPRTIPGTTQIEIREVALEDFNIKIKDKFGREDFMLQVEEVSVSSEGEATLILLNPNNFDVHIDIYGHWFYDEEPYGLDIDAGKLDKENWVIPGGETITVTHTLDVDSISTGNLNKKRYFRYFTDITEGLDSVLYSLPGSETKTNTFIYGDKTAAPTITNVSSISSQTPGYRNIRAHIKNNAGEAVTIRLEPSGKVLGELNANQGKIMDITLGRIIFKGTVEANFSISAEAQGKGKSDVVSYSGLINY